DAGPMPGEIDAIVNWLVTERSVYVICGAIGALGTVALVWFSSKVWSVRKRIRSVSVRVEGCGSPAGFVAAFPELDEELSRDGLLGHAWDEFRETLISPTPSVPVFRNPEPPELFFTTS